MLQDRLLCKLARTSGANNIHIVAATYGLLPNSLTKGNFRLRVIRM